MDLSAKAFGLVGLLAFSAAFAQDAGVPHNYRPPAGYVPDANTAVGIAVAVWLPIYGQKQIDSEKPYKATLKDGVWTVTGSMPPHRPEQPMVGGVALAEISKIDGKILRVSHGL